MRRFVQLVLLVLIGLALLHASLFTDLYLRYVKPGMRPMLIASGALLLVLGAAEAWSYRRRSGGGARHGDRDDHHDPDGDPATHDHDSAPAAHDHGHDHSGTPRVAWLLLLPALSLLFYAPPTLGAYTASRAEPQAVAKVPEREGFDPLPATSPLPMTLTDFTERVQQDRKQAIKGRSVQLTGFVTPDGAGDSWDLTRIIFSCCAADARSVKVRVHGSTALPANTWVTVTGTWHPGGTLGTSSAGAALDAVAVKKIERPFNAYLDALPPAPR
ncbi:TIGR03943 family putative permease subunit [Streptomyces griseus]|uniref:TIGR03943 family putative permease subunit n=1 Tax=Streptomyces griseus TaxID=1911 RepID=UPI00055B455D|nr:TIGR03943 family protein [Streptomyces griseus]